MKLSFHLHLPSFKLFADDFNELSDAVDFVTLTAGFAMEQWREVQVKILIDGKTSVSYTHLTLPTKLEV